MKVVRVSGTDMCGEQCSGGSSDWYSAVGECYCVSAYGVNCLHLEVLHCLNCEVGGSNLQRKLIITSRSARNDI